MNVSATTGSIATTTTTTGLMDVSATTSIATSIATIVPTTELIGFVANLTLLAALHCNSRGDLIIYEGDSNNPQYICNCYRSFIPLEHYPPCATCLTIATDPVDQCSDVCLPRLFTGDRLHQEDMHEEGYDTFNFHRVNFFMVFNLGLISFRNYMANANWLSNLEQKDATK